MRKHVALAAIAALILVVASLAPPRGYAGELTAAEVQGLATAASAVAQSLSEMQNEPDVSRPNQPRFAGDIYRAAEQARIPSSLIASIIKCESDWDPLAVSSKGARGLMQVMPRTARYELGVHPDNLRDPSSNITAGTSYLRLLALRFDGDPDKVVAAYNAGPTRLSRGSTLPSETIRFRDCVRRWHARYAWLD